MYRHPAYTSQDISDFANAIQNTVDFLNEIKNEFYLVGDLNINLLKIENNLNTREYANTLISRGVKCVINKPTRVIPSSKTLIDHIYTNNVDHSLFSGIAVGDLSDHYGVFVIIPTKKRKIESRLLAFECFMI